MCLHLGVYKNHGVQMFVRNNIMQRAEPERLLIWCLLEQEETIAESGIEVSYFLWIKAFGRNSVAALWLG